MIGVFFVQVGVFMLKESGEMKISYGDTFCFFFVALLENVVTDTLM